MSFLQIIILSLIQGLTEFLPVSSSAHLILVPHVFGWADQGLMMDIAVHVGTLGAVVLYFWRDILGLLKGFYQVCLGEKTYEAQFVLGLICATIPAVILGVILSKIGMHNFRSMIVLGVNSIVFGILLYWVDKIRGQERSLKDLTLGSALLIGCAQALALIPGTSRSGVCITMGRYLKINRVDAARYAFLLSIPAIVAAAVYQTYSGIKEGSFFLSYDLALGILFSFAAGILGIHCILQLLKKTGFAFFMIYRVLLGGVLLFFWLWHQSFS